MTLDTSMLENVFLLHTNPLNYHLKYPKRATLNAMM